MTDPSERLAQLQRLRQDGNAKFKDGDLVGARTIYEDALKLSSSPGKSDGQEVSARLLEEYAAVRIPVQLNLALCCLRAQPCEAFRALELCEEVLSLEPDNAKAAYRKAKALIELNEVKEAEYELVRACKLMPKDPAARKDLEQLRQKLRDEKAKQAETFRGLFEKSPGFASDARAASASLSAKDIDDIYFHEGKDNPFEGAECPQDLARELQATGKLEDAAQAWEAAMGKTAASEDWTSHFCYSLEFGMLLMDLNIDRLALRCFNTIFERPVSTEAGDTARLDPVKKHSLLLKAICLVNEADGDPKAEVTACLDRWMREAHADYLPTADGTPLDTCISDFRKEKGIGASADTAVALGLLQLLGGQEAALQTFAAALRAPVDDSCFGCEARRSTRWNMLGAVLANRNQLEHALLAYKEAVSRQPHYPRALINMGIAQERRSDHLSAIACYAAAIACAPLWSAGEIWASLEKVAVAQSSIDELARAAKEKDLTQVQSLLSSVPSPTASQPNSTEEVLAKIGLTAA